MSLRLKAIGLSLLFGMIVAAVLGVGGFVFFYKDDWWSTWLMVIAGIGIWTSRDVYRVARAHYDADYRD
jgi:hypothetical protein